MNHAGINIGYGHTKIKTDNHENLYASVIEPADEGLGDAQQKRTTRRVIVSGQVYEVGEQAALLSRTLNSSKAVFAKWGHGLHYQVLKQSVIDQLAREGRGPWKVVLGVPVDQFKDREYREYIRAQWTGVMPSLLGNIEIVQAKVTPEPMGSYVTHAVRVATTPAEEVIIIDFGYHTTGWVTLRQGEPVAKLSDSINTGVVSVLRHVDDMLRKQWRLEFDFVDLEAALVRRKPLYHKKDVLDLSSAWRSAIADVGKNIEARMRSLLGATKPGAEIILTGGGAAIFGETITKTYSDRWVATIAGPQMANAIGYWHMAQQLR